MPANRTLALLRTAATLLGATLLVPLMSACPKGDVGAPCNHGDVQAPESQVVTFPALSCNDLLCVFAQKDDAPKVTCKSDAECNITGDGVTRFTCSNGDCQLDSTYVLQRSMCSRACETDDDCLDGGIGKKVLAKETSCDSGFRCAKLQKLGEFCCKKLCVCGDDLSDGTLKALDEACGKFEKDVDGNPMCNQMPMEMAPTQ